MLIYANSLHGLQMFSQISHIPDLIRKFWAKRCGLYAIVYNNFCNGTFLPDAFSLDALLCDVFFHDAFSLDAFLHDAVLCDSLKCDAFSGDANQRDAFFVIPFRAMPFCCQSALDWCMYNLDDLIPITEYWILS